MNTTASHQAGGNGLPSLLPELKELLERRLRIISDETLRVHDPAGQFDQLRRVSEEITAFHQKHRPVLPAKLNHFLERASFQKAADFIGDLQG